MVAGVFANKAPLFGIPIPVVVLLIAICTLLLIYFLAKGQ